MESHEDTMPRDWSWKQSFNLIAERFWRRKTQCRTTRNVPSSIYLECIYQCCVQRMVLDKSDADYHQKARVQEKYREFLNLPMGIVYQNSLIFAVTHRHHGSQLRYGWHVNAQSHSTMAALHCTRACAMFSFKGMSAISSPPSKASKPNIPVLLPRTFAICSSTRRSTAEKFGEGNHGQPQETRVAMRCRLPAPGIFVWSVDNCEVVFLLW